MNRKKQIELEIGKLRNELNEIEDKEQAEVHFPRLEKMVGTCWAYRDNSYGGGKVSERWDVFKKILEVFYNKDGLLMFITEEFSMDYKGKCSLEIDTRFPYPYDGDPFNSGYEKITTSEYEQNRWALLAEMSNPTKLKKKA